MKMSKVSYPTRKRYVPTNHVPSTHTRACIWSVHKSGIREIYTGSSLLLAVVMMQEIQFPFMPLPPFIMTHNMNYNDLFKDLNRPVRSHVLRE